MPKKAIKINTDVKKAKKIIMRDAAPEQCFWVCTGQIAKNLRELADILERMPKEIFNYHVNSKKNDFAKWIADVFNEEGLAKEISKTRGAKAIAKKIKVRIAA